MPRDGSGVGGQGGAGHRRIEGTRSRRRACAVGGRGTGGHLRPWRGAPRGHRGRASRGGPDDPGGRHRARRTRAPRRGDRRTVRRDRHPGRERGRSPAGPRPRCGGRAGARRDQREPADLDPAGAGRGPAHAGRRMGADLPDHLVRRQTADPDARVLEHRPHGPLGVGEDGRAGSHRRRHHPEPCPARSPRHRQGEGARRRRTHGRSRTTSARSSRSSAHSRPDS